MKKIKGLLKSKYLWGNLLALALLIYPRIFGAEVPHLPEEAVTYADIAFNILNRFFTNKPLSEKTKVFE